jgi:hypothetical protein
MAYSSNGSLIEEARNLLHERRCTLKERAVAGVGIETELRVAKLFEERNGIRRRHHDVVVAIDDQGRLLDGARSTSWALEGDPHTAMALTCAWMASLLAGLSRSCFRAARRVKNSWPAL